LSEQALLKSREEALSNADKEAAAAEMQRCERGWLAVVSAGGGEGKIGGI